MKKATAEYVKSVCAAQLSHTENLKRPGTRQTTEYQAQRAYYVGMITMLDIIASEGYTLNRTREAFLSGAE